MDKELIEDRKLTEADVKAIESAMQPHFEEVRDFGIETGVNHKGESNVKEKEYPQTTWEGPSQAS